MDPLLSTNVKSPTLGKRLTIVGTCLGKDAPRVLKGFKEPILHICLQEHHVDGAAWKVLTLARVNKIERIDCFTQDGSPHCLGLHHALEDVKAALGGQVEVNHWVIHKGEAVKVGSKAIKTSRHLMDIEDMIK